MAPQTIAAYYDPKKHVKHKARGYVYTLKYVDELKVACERSMSSFQLEINKIKDGPSTYRYMDIN